MPLGLALSFTFATVALAYVIDTLGLPDDLARKLAIAVLAVFGVILLLPPLLDRVEASASRLIKAPAAIAARAFGPGCCSAAASADSSTWTGEEPEIFPRSASGQRP